MSDKFVKFIVIFGSCLQFVKFGNLYNIDPGNAVIFQGPKDSSFGYSVGILENAEGILILVGAPTDNSTTEPEINRPGQLYKCNFNKKRVCQTIGIHNVGNVEETLTYNSKRITFHNDLNNQWLGMSLDVEPTNHSHVVVCAPRWKDSYLERKMKGMFHMTGLCFLLTSDLSRDPRILPSLCNLKRLVNRKGHFVEFSMGQMGISAVFSKENGSLLFGAPGLNDWTGGVVKETITGNQEVQYIEPPIHQFQNSYSGYALSTGKFTSRDRNSIAVGSPRADTIGKKTPVKASSKAKKQKKEPPAPKPVKKCLQMVAKELELTELNQQLELVEEDEIYSPIPSPMCISPDPETPEPARSKLAFPEPATSESTAAPQPLPCTECFSTRQDVKVLQSQLEVANNVISELQSKMHTLQYYVQILWEKDQRQQYAFLGGGNQFYRPYSPVPDTSLRQRPAFHAHCSPASPVATPCTPSPHHSRPTDSVSRQPAQPTIFNSPSPVQLSEKSQQPDLTEVPNDEPEQPLESQPPATPYNPDSQKSQQTDLTEVHVPVPSNEPEQLDSQPPLTPFYNGYTEVLLYSDQSTSGPLLTVSGTQPGSYFGASLCSLTNGEEQLDYLIIGAPMFKGHGPEEGRVFVYRSHGLLGFKLAVTLSGMNISYSRFGLTVANVGDLDGDSYEDIAVGAPFENGGGSVYIFNGYRQGVWPQYTKRVTSQEVSFGVRGFGVSFSRPYDVDKNGYLDFVVGAHITDQTAVLLTTPLVDMSQSTLAVTNQMRVKGCIKHGVINTTCQGHNLLQTELTYCLGYSGNDKGFPSSIVVRFTIGFDASRNISRVFKLDNGKIRKVSSISEKKKLKLDKTFCDNMTVYVQYTEESNEDILFRLEYNVKGRKVMLRQFNGSLVNPVISNIRHAKLILGDECHTEPCYSHMDIDTTVSVGPGNSMSYIVGTDDKIFVTVTINNVDEIRSSYIEMKLEYLNSVSFIQALDKQFDKRLPCDISFVPSSFVLCTLTKEENDKMANWTVVFEFYYTKDDPATVSFNISATSRTGVSDNVTLSLPVASESNITLTGNSFPEEIIFKTRSKNGTLDLRRQISYNFIVHNSGPSILRTSSILFSYPELPSVIEMDGLHINSSSDNFSKYLCGVKKRGEISSQLLQRIDDRENLKLICRGGHAYCAIIACNLHDINPRSSVTLTINMIIDVHKNKVQRLRHVALGSTAIFRNSSNEESWDHFILHSTSSDRTEAIIEIYNIDLTYDVREVQMWIIIISGAGGIALFLAISLFMFKVGFFRRLDNEDLQLRKANWKLRMSESSQQQNGVINGHRRTFRHNARNPCFTAAIDDDETHVLIPFSNGSLTNLSSSFDDLTSISSDISDESGYLEPVKTRKQRVFIKQ